MTNAIINITNLRLRTYIGFNPEEQEKQQDVVVNAEIHYPASRLCFDDHIEGALNYKDITKRMIRHIEEGRFLLLEKLVADILDICSEHEWVTFAKVKIDKPHALRFADSVSITLIHDKLAEAAQNNHKQSQANSALANDAHSKTNTEPTKQTAA
ncbi:dihydroneopterin triphosphate 2'-epimerase [Marinibactrum halimedae]|uniref:Dihydroneopterin triphosphate 2'-epimerase n=1 Tax=Marinibactrum halimedae TaxID=1444977 RepID=A0AA37WKW9_9GAMM|nr:dihydroneopterin triphosphate 2'-epimerase [Marinibactrum halimedae]MCD9458193.1 dihydroneopterin triphosphate 2'-epimerase [Marinibactrum halimedae]GLS25129.1 hypothetical protein GCM10007877_08430 [Marinibactrum halimedae]